jgi:hypothetical protein
MKSEQNAGSVNGYDIIGDIHGYADKLEALLKRLGYCEIGGVWRHPTRSAIFVGDFIDRGPAQVRTVRTVRRMVEYGAALAVMGNHELNAIAWHTPHPELHDEFLRSHFNAKWGQKNRKQHAAFLAEVERIPALHNEIINWFLTLPLWLELPELRVVHACWHPQIMAWLSPQLCRGRYLTRRLMVAATSATEDKMEEECDRPTIFEAVECLTKGPEVPLPAGHSFLDKDGNPRDRVRVRWWNERATTFKSAAVMPHVEAQALPDLPIPPHARIQDIGSKPIFFGHYWLTGTPSLETSHAVCLDYSAGKGGPLVAYRFNSESELCPDHLVWVD